MPNILRYTDFRHFLADAFAERKAAWKHFSHRHVAQKTELSVGYFSKILSGRNILPLDKAQRFADLFSLYGPQREAFLLMVQIDLLRESAERRHCQKRLQELRDEDSILVSEHQHAFYAQWYHTPIREMAALLPVPSPEKIAALLFPPVSPQEVQASLQLLLELELIEALRGPQGSVRYRRRDRILRSGSPSGKRALTEYAAQSIDQGKQALFELPLHEREIASLVVSLSEQGKTELFEILAQTRKDILALAARDKKAHQVWHINLQSFPHAKWESSQDRESSHV